MLIRQAVFLVGGRGTRLGSLTGGTPKPLLEVGGAPFLDYLIINAARFGFTRILLLAGYLGSQVADRYRSFGDALNLEIECVVEPREAGTGGALHYARDKLDDVFCLFNGDTFFDFNFLDLFSMATPDDWVAKIALRRVPDASRYGVVSQDGDRITRMAERGGTGEAFINGGIYLLKREIVEEFTGYPCSIEADIFPRLVAKGQMYGRGYDGFFLDIGVPDDFARAQVAIPAQMRRPAVFFDRDGVLNLDTGYVHRPDQFQWQEGAIETIKHFNDAGYYVFVVTNQAGVARGYYGEDDVHALHRWMSAVLAEQGAHIDSFYYCPHHPEGSRAGYGMACDCRKPMPGMLLSAMRDWSVLSEKSFLIGDKQWDLDAARAAGIPGVLFSGGNLLDMVSRAPA